MNVGRLSAKLIMNMQLRTWSDYERNLTLDI